MGFFSKLFDKGHETTPQRVLVVSRGLSALGQREIALSVKLRRDEQEANVRAQLEAFLGTVRSLAEEGRLVEAGGLTEFGQRGLLDSSVGGLAYGDHPEAPSNALVGVLLGDEEIELAKTAGVTRVLTRLGEATREYPFPFTSDRDRPSVALPGDEHSMLAHLPRLHAPRVSLSFANDVLVVTCLRSTGAWLREALEQLPADSGFALLTQPSTRANGRLVWKPGQTSPAAITPPGSTGNCLTGGMLIVGPNVDEDLVRMHEDGFAVVATAETWCAMRRALVEETAFALAPSEGGAALQIEFVEPGTHLPAEGVTGPEEIVLLTSEEEIANAVSVEELSGFIGSLMQVLAPVEAAELHVELTPGRGAKTNSDVVLPADIQERMHLVESPAVRGPVAFLIRKRLLH